VAERIRSDIERLAMPHTGSPFGHVTASIGLASCQPERDSDPDLLVRAADRALYESKSSGRNRITARTAQLESTQRLPRLDLGSP
jgi:diguanylate cyclase (GGDEF)-like protein